ncbi:MAG: thioesterase family protein [Melioribacteraceae bacterium]|nr:thioesterase family protein [Melioribacteraceae bacterium]
MFQTKERLSFYDCDPAGIIFFASLLKIAHTTYEKFLAHISPNRNFFFDKELVLPIIHCEADYHKPLKAFDEIDVSVVVKDVRDNSFELNYKFEIDSKLYAEAKTIHVCVEKNKFEKTSLPIQLKEKLNENLQKT